VEKIFMNENEPIDRTELEEMVRQGTQDFRERFERWKADAAATTIPPTTEKIAALLSPPRAG
jgi:hypothetical protein